MNFCGFSMFDGPAIIRMFGGFIHVCYLLTEWSMFLYSECLNVSGMWYGAVGHGACAMQNFLYSWRLWCVFSVCVVLVFSLSVFCINLFIQYLYINLFIRDAFHTSVFRVSLTIPLLIASHLTFYYWLWFV
jgi:hypothetical protein